MSVSQTPLHIHEKEPGEFDIIAILSPKADKADRLEQVLRDITQKVHDNEPGVLRYQLTKKIGDDGKTPEFVMIETYKSQKDSDEHVVTPAFKDLVKTFKTEGLLSKPMVVLRVKSVAGFERRKSKI